MRPSARIAVVTVRKRNGTTRAVPHDAQTRLPHRCTRETRSSGRRGSRTPGVAGTGTDARPPEPPGVRCRTGTRASILARFGFGFGGFGFRRWGFGRWGFGGDRRFVHGGRLGGALAPAGDHPGAAAAGVDGDQQGRPMKGILEAEAQHLALHRHAFLDHVHHLGSEAQRPGSLVKARLQRLQLDFGTLPASRSQMPVLVVVTADHDLIVARRRGHPMNVDEGVAPRRDACIRNHRE